MITCGHQSRHLVHEWLSQPNPRAWLCSAYIKKFTLEDLLAGTEAGHVALFARWQLFDLVQGSSDLSAAAWAIDQGFEFRVNPRLHAKVYLVGNQTWVGSANLSRNGMPSQPYQGNIELGVSLNVNADIENFFDEMFKSSVLITPALLAELEVEVSETRKSSPNLKSYASRLPNALEKAFEHRDAGHFYSADLPWCERPSELLFGNPNNQNVRHDLELLNLTQPSNLPAIRDAFRQTRIYAWLRTMAVTPQRFGALTKSLHDKLADEPRPYRKDVKRLLSNLYQWAEELLPEEFEIYVPGDRSTFIRYLPSK